MLPTTIYPDGDEIFFFTSGKKEPNKMEKKKDGEKGVWVCVCVCVGGGVLEE